MLYGTGRSAHETTVIAEAAWTGICFWYGRIASCQVTRDELRGYDDGYDYLECCQLIRLYQTPTRVNMCISVAAGPAVTPR